VREWSWRNGPLLAVAVVATLLGTAAALRYATLGLTLSHYDARGHLVVSRRVLDSITPGWQQIGAVWLPLPHLLDILPSQVDAWYRGGTFAIAISIASFVLAAAAIAWVVVSITGSWAAAAAGALVFALNPNVLYLQATPMTEPLLMALMVVSIGLLTAYCVSAAGSIGGVCGRAPSSTLVGVAFALACLTRYEAWPVTIGALLAAVWVLWRQGVSAARAIRRIATIALWPGAAIVGFSVFSRIVVGSWFANGFFVPENVALGHPEEALDQIVWGLRELSGPTLVAVGAAGAVSLTATALFIRRRATDILPLALLGMAAVPWSAFVDGHPYRIRYMLPLVAAQAVFAGAAAGLWKKARPLTVALLVAIAAFELKPFSTTAPMVAEAQWDKPNIAAREAVTTYLTHHYRGESIMASMGSLGHYMQDLSRAGLAISDFLHEGNGDIWLNALDSPRPFAGWILIEEKAEGGDMLAAIARTHPRFLDGYTRVCEAAGVALYRRTL
jgi:hypothetical protein